MKLKFNVTSLTVPSSKNCLIKTCPQCPAIWKKKPKKWHVADSDSDTDRCYFYWLNVRLDLLVLSYINEHACTEVINVSQLVLGI